VGHEFLKADRKLDKQNPYETKRNSSETKHIDNSRNNSLFTCIASLFPAWDPPLMTLKAGTGSTKCLVSSKICNVLQMVAERDRK
jgi:hypothetical protein